MENKPPGKTQVFSKISISDQQFYIKQEVFLFLYLNEVQTIWDSPFLKESYEVSSPLLEQILLKSF